MRSSLHGYGLVALKAFKEGDMMADIEGVTWREGEWWDDKYTLRITDAVSFDMVDQTRWLNHSCTANAEIDLGLDEHGEPWARLYAWRDIAAGEEVTYDYEFPAAFAEPCTCGSPQCRGWIVREDELTALLATKSRVD